MGLRLIRWEGRIRRVGSQPRSFEVETSRVASSRLKNENSTLYHFTTVIRPKSREAGERTAIVRRTSASSSMRRSYNVGLSRRLLSLSPVRVLQGYIHNFAKPNHHSLKLHFRLLLLLPLPTLLCR